MSFPLASVTVYNSLVFGVFSNAQRLISQYRHGDERRACGMLDLAVASGLTGLVSVGLGAPVDLLAGNATGSGNVVQIGSAAAGGGVADQRLYRGPVHCVSSILRSEGLAGLYRGGGAMVLRDVPGYVLYFLPYTVFCELLSPDGKSSAHPVAICLAGGLAGSISWVTATPADVVKSRMQADAMLHRKYTGVLHCIGQSYRTEGLQVFFRGASVNAIRGFPMSATMFLAYELSLKFFRSF
ncbi:hypothetical protein NHX12_011442 [Muraenolepis orangiensis]|nr:hypothetical protein NHX12_011442 [Muraenolepis orangiensis]